jgi:HAD superfamily hydrolase (TIGR01509 family)
MMQKPRAVIFDLGKVLLDFDYGKVAARMLKYCDLPREAIIRALNQSPLLHRYETGLMSTSQFFEEVKTVSKFCGQFSDFEGIFADIFTPIPQMIDLNTRLRSREVPTYIFSNTNELAIKHIRETYPFFANFTGYIFSYEHRSMKPDPGIYTALERITKNKGAELLYVDDRVENVEQGAARGWQTIHHTNHRETIVQVEAMILH